MTIQNEFYKFRLPFGWKNHPAKNGKAYFENGAGNIGLYSCAIITEKDESDETISRSILEIQKKAYFNNKDYSWEVVTDSVLNQDALWFGTLEIYDRNKSYRIVTICITKNKVSVELNFHDYDCKEIDKSNKVSKKIFNSFKYLS